MTSPPPAPTPLAPNAPSPANDPQADTDGWVTRQTAANAVSPKITWAAAASALSTIVWTIIAASAPAVFTPATVATLTGASATVLAFAGGYLVRDTLRHRPPPSP